VAAARNSGLRVLVVDDEPSVGDSLRRILALSGHKAEIVPRADEALRLFEPGKFDLVIADYAMPGMKGDALVAAIRARAPGQRIVILTGFAEDVRACEPPVAADLVISKPLNLLEFLDRVQSLFA
jgi:DNA-binding response OmpR family regulator